MIPKLLEERLNCQLEEVGLVSHVRFLLCQMKNIKFPHYSYHGFILLLAGNQEENRRESRHSSRSSSTMPPPALSANGRRGMVLPFEQHSITFDEIKYSVDMPVVS